jgi:hypothetical protein
MYFLASSSSHSLNDNVCLDLWHDFLSFYVCCLCFCMWIYVKLHIFFNCKCNSERNFNILKIKIFYLEVVVSFQVINYTNFEK